MGRQTMGDNIMSDNWTELKHGGEVWDGGYYDEAPVELGKEVGHYQENNEDFVFHVNKTDGYVYLTIRMQGKAPRPRIIIRVATWEDWQQ